MPAPKFRYRVYFEKGPPREVTASSAASARKTAIAAQRLVGYKLRGELAVFNVEKMFQVGSPPFAAAPEGES